LHTISVPPGADDAAIEQGCRALLEAAAPRSDASAEARAPETPQGFAGKRILSLDGGGSRVALQLGMLEHVEKTLREAGRIAPQGVLSDYFDMIGGISAGSVVAALLAQGRTVPQTIDELKRLGRERPIRNVGASALLFPSSANNKRMRKALTKRFGATTEEQAGFKTLYTAVVWRVDKPSYEYFSSNKHDPLWNSQSALQLDRYPRSSARLVDVLSAASAVPALFAPVKYPLGPKDKDAILLDGAANNTNPSLALIDYATSRASGLGWPAEQDSLYLLSAGCGIVDHPTPNLLSQPPLVQAITVLANNLEHRILETVQQCQSMCETRKPFYVRGFGATSISKDRRGSSPSSCARLTTWRSAPNSPVRSPT
jgi:patatin-like phospholipase/acyl hydrolase